MVTVSVILSVVLHLMQYFLFGSIPTISPGLEYATFLNGWCIDTLVPTVNFNKNLDKILYLFMISLFRPDSAFFWSLADIGYSWHNSWYLRFLEYGLVILCKIVIDQSSG